MLCLVDRMCFAIHCIKLLFNIKFVNLLRLTQRPSVTRINSEVSLNPNNITGVGNSMF